MTTDHPTTDGSLSPKIGILDSGVGGLSVLNEIREKLPQIPLHYIGDSAWCPYGNKSSAEIQQRVTALSQYLIEHGATIIIIACNSATIHAIEHLRKTFSIPFVGMEPAVKPATELSRTHTIGILATEASIAGEKFHHLLHTHAPPSKVKVITQPCPQFVELVENGVLHGPEVNDAIHAYIKPILDAGADTLVLGCTHYPFLKPAIKSLLGDTINILCTGEAVANRTASLIENHDAKNANPVKIETTGDLILLKKILPTLCPDISNHITISSLPTS